MRMGMASVHATDKWFLEKLQNHLHMLSLYFLHYNFCRIHKTLKVTPAMEAGTNERAARHGMDRQPDRRAGTEAESSGDLPQAADFKLRHYPRLSGSPP